MYIGHSTWRVVRHWRFHETKIGLNHFLHIPVPNFREPRSVKACSSRTISQAHQSSIDKTDASWSRLGAGAGCRQRWTKLSENFPELYTYEYFDSRSFLQLGFSTHNMNIKVTCGRWHFSFPTLPEPNATIILHLYFSQLHIWNGNGRRSRSLLEQSPSPTMRLSHSSSIWKSESWSP